MSPELTQAEFNRQLLQFLQASPTAFHATQTMAAALLAAGFAKLEEADSWQMKVGQRYFVTRNDSSLIAFVYGRQPLLDTGIRMFGAHTDSPCLKIKPQPELTRKGYLQLAVEVYGGALLAPWFDRDLSLAGRVTYLTLDGTLASSLIDFKVPVAVVPSLAIHLDREVNNMRTINPQKDIVPLLLQFPLEQQGATPFKNILYAHLKQQHPSCDATQVLDFDISLYDTQAPALVGLQQDFIASARLDNLLSCFVGLQALLAADGEVSSLLICSDHEEVGSTSCCGANGPMLEQFLQRLIADGETRIRTIERSLLISADNAHGVHPNFSDKHDDNHGPLLNHGPVIKVNANQRYATSSETSGFFQHLCEPLQVPLQKFVTRTDMACGSTIGPLVSAQLGVKTLDIGAPTFAMHSIRELAGVKDGYYLYRATEAFFRYAKAIVF